MVDREVLEKVNKVVSEIYDNVSVDIKKKIYESFIKHITYRFEKTYKRFSKTTSLAIDDFEEQSKK